MRTHKPIRRGWAFEALSSSGNARGIECAPWLPWAVGRSPRGCVGLAIAEAAVYPRARLPERLGLPVVQLDAEAASEGQEGVNDGGVLHALDGGWLRW